MVGIGGSYLGPRAAIELLYGGNYNLQRGTKGNPGSSLPATACPHELERPVCRAGRKDFSVVFISKSGTTTEPAIATRALRWMLERKYGTDGAKSRIFAITDPCKGALRQMAMEEGWGDLRDSPMWVAGSVSSPRLAFCPWLWRESTSAM